MFPPDPCAPGSGGVRRVPVGLQRWREPGVLSQPPSLSPQPALPPLPLLAEAQRSW